MGILYNRKLEKYDTLSNIKYFLIVFLLQFIIIYIEGKSPGFTVVWCKDFTDNLLLPFMVGFLGIAFWLRVAKILEPITKDSKVLNTISDNSLPIVEHQFLGFFILKLLFALFSRFTPLFTGFNISEFKNNFLYYYVPKDLSVLYFLYLVFGIVIPILIARILKECKGKLKRIKSTL